MPKPLVDKIKELLLVQGRHGNWDYDEYMCGLYNGLELARSVLEDDVPPPAFRSKPREGWARDHMVDGYRGAPEEMTTLNQAQDTL